MEHQNNLYLTVFLLPYILTIALNTLVIVVIYKEQALHKPMYIFICNLSCNGIYGSTSLLPHMMTKLATKSYTISLVNCFIQIFCLHTWGIVELTTLAIMGYDRYVAICTPLHYHDKMSPRKVKILIAFSWIFPFCTFPLYLVLTIRLSFCSNIIHKTHCVNFDLVQLSCTSTFVNNIVGLLIMGVYMFPQLLVILFSYAQILNICIHASKECRKKALQTCIPHLLTVINYFFGACFEIIQARIRGTQTPFGVAVFLSLYFIILQPLFDPLLYGSSSLKLYIVQFFQKRKLSPLSKR
ncbi:olfactory receptor 4B13-like [Alosa pseudoharengus]|uniref:olfactory receptor 4B13-like n=1 Tax=Alosa pseudoharengus TaxID=34774 RepID=UPI003F8A95A3